MGTLTHSLDLSGIDTRPAQVAVLGGSVAAGTAPNRLWVVRPGTYRHPDVGVFSITGEDLDQIVANFNTELARRGGVPFLPVDVDHATIRGKTDEERRAFGFIAALERDGDDVYAVVEWTAEGRDLVASQGFRFTSPVVLFGWTDTLDGGDVNGSRLHSLAMTNQPVLPDGVPIIASREAIVSLQTTPNVTNVRAHYRDNRDRAFPACVSFSLESPMAENTPVETVEEVIETPEIETPVEETPEAVEATEEETEEEETPETVEVDGEEMSVEAAVALAVSLKGKIADLEKLIPSTGTVTLAVDALSELQAKADAGAEALEKIKATEAQSRIELAISEDRITPAMADDASVISASRSDESWQVVLATNPKGATGLNTGTPLGGKADEIAADPKTALNDMILALSVEHKIDYSAAVKMAVTQNPDLAKSAGY